MVIRLAVRNITRQKKRFLLLGLAISTGFAVILASQSLVAGMVANLYSGGARYYGGHVLVHTRTFGQGFDVVRDSALATIVDGVAREEGGQAYRRSHVYDSGRIHSPGGTVVLRRIIGYPADSLPSLLEGLSIREALPPAERAGGLWISTQMSRKTGLHPGNTATIQAKTVHGAINTLTLPVSVIFDDADIFGTYTAYTSLEGVNRLMDMPPDSCTTLGILLDDHRKAPRIADLLEKRLQDGGFATFERGNNRNSLRMQVRTPYEGMKVSVLTLGDHLYNLRELLQALEASTFLFLFLVFAIIVIGILNTYKVVVRERIREIGTMRALGFTRNRIRNLFLAESLVLGVAGVAGGLLLSTLILLGITAVTFADPGNFGIFLFQGRLGFRMYPSTILIDIVLVTLSVLAGAWFPALHARRIAPAEALRTE